MYLKWAPMIWVILGIIIVLVGLMTGYRINPTMMIGLLCLIMAHLSWNSQKISKYYEKCGLAKEERPEE